MRQIFNIAGLSFCAKFVCRPMLWGLYLVPYTQNVSILITYGIQNMYTLLKLGSCLCFLFSKKNRRCGLMHVVQSLRNPKYKKKSPRALEFGSHNLYFIREQFIMLHWFVSVTMSSASTILATIVKSVLISVLRDLTITEHLWKCYCIMTLVHVHGRYVYNYSTEVADDHT